MKRIHFTGDKYVDITESDFNGLMNRLRGENVSIYHAKEANVYFGMRNIGPIETLPDKSEKCAHPNEEIRYSLTKNDIKQHRKYCPDCGWVGLLVKKEDAPENAKMLPED